MVCALLGTQSARLLEFVCGLRVLQRNIPISWNDSKCFPHKDFESAGEVAVKFIVSKPMDGFCISHNNGTLSLPKIDHPESKSKRLLYIYASIAVLAMALLAGQMLRRSTARDFC